MRYSLPLPPTLLACALALACSDAPPTSPSEGRIVDGAAGVSFAATPERPFGGGCAFQSTVLPPEPGQPANVTRFHQDLECRLTHLGLTTGTTLEIATFTATGPVFVTTAAYTAANGDQLFTVQNGTATPPANGAINFSFTETVTGGTGRFADASGSFSGAGVVFLATQSGRWEYSGGSLSY